MSYEFIFYLLGLTLFSFTFSRVSNLVPKMPNFAKTTAPVAPRPSRCACRAAPAAQLLPRSARRAAPAAPRLSRRARYAHSVPRHVTRSRCNTQASQQFESGNKL